jgi:hypothetical protein
MAIRPDATMLQIIELEGRERLPLSYVIDNAPMIDFWREQIVQRAKDVPELAALYSKMMPNPNQRKRRGGPRPMPDEKILEIVSEWLDVQRDTTQELFCGGKGIGVRTLQKWIERFKARGVIA